MGLQSKAMLATLVGALLAPWLMAMVRHARVGQAHPEHQPVRDPMDTAGSSVGPAGPAWVRRVQRDPINTKPLNESKTN
jgi:hypothetical protein